jgi:YVTN family beta-propeller protein
MDTSGAVFDPLNGDVYAANTGSNNVSVIEGTTNRVIASIPVGIYPSAAAFDSSNGDIYVENTGSDNISVITGSSNMVAATIPVGSVPSGAAFDSSNGEIYVTNQGSRNVSVLSSSTNKVIATINMPQSNEIPCAAAFDSANGDVYVSDIGQDNVIVIDGSSNTVVASIRVGANPDGIVFDSATGAIYSAAEDGNDVEVIAGSTNKVIANIGVGGSPGGEAFDSENGDVYVTNYDDSNTSVISGKTNTVIANIVVGSNPVAAAFDSQNGFVDVVNSNVGSVSIIAQPTTYNISFAEVGLAAGTSWGVVLNGTGNSSTASVIAFAEENGTYPFEVVNFTGYDASPFSGNIAVNGAPASVNISFTRVFLYPVTFTESGLPPGTRWSANLNGTMSFSSGTNITFDVRNYTYPFKIPAVAGYSPNQTSGNVTVRGLPVINSIAFTPNTIELVALAPGLTSVDVLGTTSPFTASPICLGGSCPSGATYSWNLTNGGLGLLNRSTGPVVSFAAGNTPGSVSVYVNATLNNMTVRSAPALITINVLPSITSFNVTPDLIPLGGSVGMTVQAVGGTMPYAYAYDGLPPGCASVNASFNACEPSVCGSFNITVFVVDSVSEAVNATSPVSVMCAIGVRSFTASASFVDLGNQVVLKVTAFGGLGPYSYVYSGLPAGCATQNASTLLCAPNATGNFVIRVYVNDSLSQSANRVLSLMVNRNVTISDFVASANPVDQDSSVSFAVGTSGGTSPFAYWYTGLPPGCTSSDTSSLVCSPAAPGIFIVGVNVNDSGNMSASSTLSLTVNPTLSFSTFTASPSMVDAGRPSTLTVTTSGGTEPYDYAYAGLPPGCSSSDSASVVCVPSDVGVYAIRAYVTDSAGGLSNATLSLTVNPDPAISSFSASANMIDLGGSTIMNVSVVGGIQPYAYTYAGLPAGCSSVDVSSLGCGPTASGIFSIRASVNDSDGMLASSVLTLTVNPPLSISSFVSSPNPDDVGSVTVLAVTFSGGSAPYTYTYAGLPAGCYSADVASLNCLPGSSGVYTTRIFVNDSVGGSVSVTLSLVVHATAPTPADQFGWLWDNWILLVGAAVVIVASIALFLHMRGEREDHPGSKSDVSKRRKKTAKQ